MKLLHVVRRLDAALGGAPAAAAHMASALSDKGHDVTIATTVREDGNTDELGQLVDAMGPWVRVAPFPRTRAPFDHSVELRSWLSRHLHSYDLVEVHGVFDYPAWASTGQAFRRGRPFVIHPHGSLDPFDLLKHRRAKQLLGPTSVRLTLQRSLGLLVATVGERAALCTYGASVPVHVVPLPYRPSPLRGDAARFRQRFDVQDRLVVLFLGRVDPNKGLHHLVTAFDQLVHHGVAITLVVGGDASSSYGSHLRNQVAALGLGNVIRFVGHLHESDKADALAAATVLALVSDRESYGLVLVEAARAGLPMLVSDQICLAPDLVADGAALVVSRDGTCIAGELRRLAQDPDLLARMSAASRSAAERRFDWDKVADAHSDLRLALMETWQQRRRA